VSGSSGEVDATVLQFYPTLKCVDKFFAKLPNTKFHEHSFSDSTAVIQTGMATPRSEFLQLSVANVPKNLVAFE
jgi:hypothetical protein